MYTLSPPAGRLARHCALLSLAYLLIFAYFVDHIGSTAQNAALLSELLRSVYIAAVMATAGTVFLDIGIRRIGGGH